MREGYHAAFAAINEAIAKQPQSVFTYEYLLSACDGCDPRVLNYVYFQAMQYEAACVVFRRAYAIAPTDDLARSIVRVGLLRARDVDECGVWRLG